MEDLPLSQQMIPDSQNVFERFYRGMESFCCSPDNLRQRLVAAKSQLMFLRVDDFPEPMRADFEKLMESLSASEQPRFRDTKRREIAKALLRLYTQATRLDGTLPESYRRLIPSLTFPADRS